MARFGTWIAVFVWVAAVAAGTGAREDAAFTWTLPAGVPPPPVPADNPMSTARVELGRHLFYDTRLSGTGTRSCGSCHEQARAFTDGLGRARGSTGQIHPRGSMSLVNIGYARALTWANPELTRLEAQALVPMYGQQPVELGLDSSDAWLGPLRRDPIYERLFRAAFGAPAASMSRDHVVQALACFQRALVSLRSPYDRYHFERDDTAIPDAAKRGEILFHSRPLSCFTCHGGVHFSGAMGVGPAPDVQFHNTGLYNLAGAFSYPPDNLGVYAVTQQAGDVGRFKPPTLRNIAVTGPYMHDGSVATLEDAVAHYAAGGRTTPDGPLQGVGRENPNKSDAVRGFAPTTAQRADLLAFLDSLTDRALLSDERFANPWRR